MRILEKDPNTIPDSFEALKELQKEIIDKLTMKGEAVEEVLKQITESQKLLTSPSTFSKAVILDTALKTKRRPTEAL